MKKHNLIIDQTIYLLFLLAVLAYLIAIGYVIYPYFQEGIKPYVKGELMINYSCGYLRRGLIGTLINWLSGFFSVSNQLVMNWLVGITYGYVGGWLLFSARKNGLLLLALTASPFGLLFLANDWIAVGRKEIFLFIISIACYSIIKKAPNLFRLILISILLLTGFLIHESFLLLFLPWILLFLNQYYGVRSKRQHSFSIFPIRTTWIIFGSCIFYFLLFTATHNYNLEKKVECMTQQYSSLLLDKQITTYSVISFKEPLFWLSKDLHFGIRETWEWYGKKDVLIYWLSRLGLLAGVVGITIYFFKYIHNFQFSFKANWIWYGMIAGGFLIQLIIALDWGRFFHIFYINLLIFILQNGANLRAKEQSNKQSLVNILIAAITVLTSFIMVPHMYGGGPKRSFFMQSIWDQITEVLFSIF